MNRRVCSSCMYVSSSKQWTAPAGVVVFQPERLAAKPTWNLPCPFFQPTLHPSDPILQSLARCELALQAILQSSNGPRRRAPCPRSPNFQRSDVAPGGGPARAPELRGDGQLASCRPISLDGGDGPPVVRLFV